MSTLDQKIDRQLVGLHLHRTFTDYASGEDTDRPELAQMVAYVREGDTVVGHSMERLVRNLEDLRRLVRDLTGRGVRIQLLSVATGGACQALVTPGSRD
ncbi:recombinase family protein [Bradyrhizobium aeschynomenes]|uniref:recombinase family protein n=1 Tax=Bradyrhizobium aeschynomenes TaxID=2734909 RepID=UPI003D31575D